MVAFLCDITTDNSCLSMLRIVKEPIKNEITLHFHLVLLKFDS